MVFDETLHRCIDSYLRYCPRSYDTIYNLPPEAKEKHNVLHKQVFLVCLRAATHKESKVCSVYLPVLNTTPSESKGCSIKKLEGVVSALKTLEHPLQNRKILQIDPTRIDF